MLKFGTETGAGIPVKWAELEEIAHCEVDGEPYQGAGERANIEFRGVSDPIEPPGRREALDRLVDFRAVRVEEVESMKSSSRTRRSSATSSSSVTTPRSTATSCPTIASSRTEACRDRGRRASEVADREDRDRGDGATDGDPALREGGSRRPRAIAVISGSRTNTRQAVRLRPDPTNPARWTGTVDARPPILVRTARS